jgi:hypothetical protein
MARNEDEKRDGDADKQKPEQALPHSLPSY